MTSACPNTRLSLSVAAVALLLALPSGAEAKDRALGAGSKGRMASSAAHKKNVGKLLFFKSRPDGTAQSFAGTTSFGGKDSIYALGFFEKSTKDLRVEDGSNEDGLFVEMLIKSVSDFSFTYQYPLLPADLRTNFWELYLVPATNQPYRTLDAKNFSRWLADHCDKNSSEVADVTVNVRAQGTIVAGGNFKLDCSTAKENLAEVAKAVEQKAAAPK